MTTYGSVMGIDLGTTYSCVSILQDGATKICNNEMGENTTPSVVSYEGANIFIGQEAKTKMSINPKNTIFDAKRLIGRKFNDEVVQNDKKLWPFEIVADPKGTGKPKIKICSENVEGETIEQLIMPEEVSAQILMKMAQFASREAGKEIKKAVITVPAYFNNEQRLATKRAGELAGLEVIGIINEPTAAALAYGISYTCKNNTILVFDFGGGTFDVSVLRANGSDFDVLGTNGNTHLGGADVDQIIVDMCIEDLIKKELIKDEDDLTPSQKALLRIKAEDLKKNLCTSTAKYMTMELPEFIDGKDYRKKISIASFNDACIDLFNDCLTITEDCLGQIRRPGQEPEEDPEGLDPEEITQVIFVGGSTRIQKVREMVHEMFPNSEVCSALNPDEAVAQGAAYYAASLVGEKINGYIDKINVLETTPISLGILIKGTNGESDRLSIVLPKNAHTKRPVTKSYYSHKDGQKCANIVIYEGDDQDDLSNDNLIGMFKAEFPPNAPLGTQVDVTFETDGFGILTVTAAVKGGKEQKTDIKPDDHAKTEEEVVAMRERLAEKNKQREIQNRKYSILNVKKQAEGYLDDCDCEKRDLLYKIIESLDMEMEKGVPSITPQELNSISKEIEKIITIQ